MFKRKKGYLFYPIQNDEIELLFMTTRFLTKKECLLGICRINKMTFILLTGLIYKRKFYKEDYSQILNSKTGCNLKMFEHFLCVPKFKITPKILEYIVFKGYYVHLKYIERNKNRFKIVWNEHLELFRYCIKNYELITKKMKNTPSDCFLFLIDHCEFCKKDQFELVRFSRQFQSERNNCFEIFCRIWDLNPPDDWITTELLFKMGRFNILKEKRLEKSITKKNIELLLGLAIDYIKPSIVNQILDIYKKRYPNCRLIKDSTPLIQCSYFYEHKRNSKKIEIDMSMMMESLIK